MKALPVCLLLLLMTSGCAISTPTPLHDATAVAPLFSPLQNHSSEVSKILIIRDTGISGMLLDITVFLDGKVIGKLRPKEFVEFEIHPGVHIIGVGCTPCNEDYRKELQMVAVSGQEHRFRTMFLHGLEIQPSTQVK